MNQNLPLEPQALLTKTSHKDYKDILSSLEMVRQILECQHFARLNFSLEHADGFVPYDLAIVDHARKQLDYAVKLFRKSMGLMGAVAPDHHGFPQYIDVRGGLKSASQLLRHRLEHALVVEWLPSDLPKIYADPDEFREICYNLFLSCVLGLQGCVGRITVEAIVQPPTQTWPGGVRVRFYDSGPSVLDHHLHMIFDPSFFIEEPRRIDGLLLYITKRLVEKNAGRAVAYSCFGSATAICVDLPNGPIAN